MTQTPINNLLEIMVRLRDPEDGCPWDIEQDFSSIAPYTIEEAYEVADAIRRGDLVELKDELGDLLFQVVFHAQIAKEAGAFDFNDVVRAISEKMMRRHPHVFGDATIADAAAQTEAWEAHKERERRAKSGGDGGKTGPGGVLDDVPVALPALTRAVKLQKRAARVGFDWPNVKSVISKVHEELGELESALNENENDTTHRSEPSSSEEIVEELGDLLFVIANLARKFDISPEMALSEANAKFTRRFRRIEALIDQAGMSLEEAGLPTLDRLWDQAKAEEDK